jgi:hypothetical protein
MTQSGRRVRSALFDLIGAKRGTFAFLTGTVEAPRKEMKKIKGLKIHALKPGEKL